MKIEELKDLFDLPAVTIYDCLCSLNDEQQNQLKEFNWLGLAEMATSRMQFQADPKNLSESLEWGKIAILVYERLCKQNNNDYSFEISGMRTRAFLISNVGAKENDAILDFSILNKWFLDFAKSPVDEIIQKAKQAKISLSNSNRTKLDIEKLKELRLLKNRLAVFKPLKDKGILPHNSKVNEYLEIFYLLP